MAGLGRILLAAALFIGTCAASALAKKPNIVFVITDDQDWHMQSLDYMPLLQKHIVQEGTTFDQHYCTISVCCPSRVNLWTGQAAHNTNVTDLVPPYGGYPKFVQEGLNDAWLPVWLQELGYNTYYVGKLFNAHSVDTYNHPHVKGFNGSEFQLDPFTYEYYNTWMTRNGAPPVSYKGQYSPDVVAEKAYGFLEEATTHDEPFFLGIAPVAPHSNVKLGDQIVMTTTQYAPRHAHLFKDYQIPRTPNFNPDTPSGVSWVKDLPQLNDTVIEYNDEFQRARLRSLQSVDEMVEHLIHKLEAKGILDNTYFFYTTDNGFHISQHRLHPGKECPFETDIHIPLIIRGPGIPAGHTAGVVSSHTDMTPTILKLAGSDRPDLDGLPLPLTADALATPESGEHVNVEFWGRAGPEGIYGREGPDFAQYHNNTYKALRIIGKGYNLLYTVWCTGEKELYDLSSDPDEMTNLLTTDTESMTSFSLLGRPLQSTISRLDALLMVLKSCKADSCRQPWSVLHPAGNVKTLAHALKTEYDGFYEGQPKVAFSSCQLGYLVEEEGPQDVNVFGGRGGEWMSGGEGQGQQQQTFQYEGHWSWWT